MPEGNILVVDDEERQREIYRDILHSSRRWSGRSSFDETRWVPKDLQYFINAQKDEAAARRGAARRRRAARDAS